MIEHFSHPIKVGDYFPAFSGIFNGYDGESIEIITNGCIHLPLPQKRKIGTTVFWSSTEGYNAHLGSTDASLVQIGYVEGRVDNNGLTKINLFIVKVDNGPKSWWKKIFTMDTDY